MEKPVWVCQRGMSDEKVDSEHTDIRPLFREQGERRL